MTVVMGIVNVTPDSFSDGGRFLDAETAVAHGLHLRAQGADILDVGGESTRPGAERVDPAVEQERVVPVVRALADAGCAVSIDTMNAATALAAVEAGARIVNDVSGGLADPDLLAAVAPTGADVVLGHWRGPSADMYAGAEYGDVVADVLGELARRVEAAAAAGIAPSRLIVDPGIGFGKRGDQNWAALRGTTRLAGLGPRVLIGTSRKRFLAETLAAPGTATAPGTAAAPGAAADPAEVDERRRDLATAVTSVLAAQAGAWGVRVHDVAATVDALRIVRAWEGEGRWTSPTRSR
jgi:dihydropteroate synthase